MVRLVWSSWVRPSSHSTFRGLPTPDPFAQADSVSQEAARARAAGADGAVPNPDVQDYHKLAVALIRRRAADTLV